MTNVANDFFRKKTTEREIMVKVPVNVIENIPKEDDEEVFDEIQDERILEALDGLSEGTRVVTYLRCVCNFSYVKLMDATGISCGAIRQRVRCGKEKLREELKDYMPKDFEKETEGVV